MPRPRIPRYRPRMPLFGYPRVYRRRGFGPVIGIGSILVILLLVVIVLFMFGGCGRSYYYYYSASEIYTLSEPVSTPFKELPYDSDQ